MALASNLVQIGIIARQADFLGDTQEDAITATGTTLATAYPLTKSINRITTAVFGANCVRLPAIGATKYSQVMIRNDTAAGVSVYPDNAAEAINNGAGGALDTLAAGTGAIYFVISASCWLRAA